MNFTTIILALLTVIVTLGGVIYVQAKEKKTLKQNIKSLENEKKLKDITITELQKYISKLQLIKADERATANKIKEAKTDEELYQIMSCIVSANNSRVQDN